MYIYFYLTRLDRITEEEEDFEDIYNSSQNKYIYFVVLNYYFIRFKPINCVFVRVSTNMGHWMEFQRLELDDFFCVIRSEIEKSAPNNNFLLGDDWYVVILVGLFQPN